MTRRAPVVTAVSRAAETFFFTSRGVAPTGSTRVPTARRVVR
jgi:hypothetical protein